MDAGRLAGCLNSSRVWPVVNGGGRESFSVLALVGSDLL